MDIKTKDLQSIVDERLKENHDDDQKWAAEFNVKIQPIEMSHATGSVEWGGALMATVILELVFGNGVKRNFNGRVIGAIVGLSGGVGSYSGAIPNIGDKWNFHSSARDVGAGYFAMAFNPVMGPRGEFIGPTAGGGAIFEENYGYGIWTEG